MGRSFGGESLWIFLVKLSRDDVDVVFLIEDGDVLLFFHLVHLHCYNGSRTKGPQVPQF